MNSEQFSQFMQYQNGVFKQMVDAMRQMGAPQAAARQPAEKAAALPVPLPPPLELEGDMEQNFEFFVQNWKNYVSAVGMSGHRNRTSKKQGYFCR